jgi:hypothetical protein
MIVSPNEDDIFAAIRAFLQNVLPLQSTGPDVPFVVVAGQDNRVPEPIEDNYIVFWPLRMPRLATTSEAQASAGLAATYMTPSQCTIQLDVHGSSALDNASIVQTMFRSSYAVDFFAGLGDTIAPLYADDPRNMPFISGEQQYEDRYILEANLQVNQTIITPAQSAQTLVLDIIDVETDSAGWPNSTITAP